MEPISISIDTTQATEPIDALAAKVDSLTKKVADLKQALSELASPMCHTIAVKTADLVGAINLEADRLGRETKV